MFLQDSSGEPDIKHAGNIDHTPGILCVHIVKSLFLD